jgi:hypothetical protein
MTMHAASPWLARARALLVVGVLWFCVKPVDAAAGLDVDSGGPPNGLLSAQASLDFTINIGKFLFFRVGTGAYGSVANTTVDRVTFNLAIPPVPTTPPAGANNVQAPWDMTLPIFVGSSNVLGAEVRSNAGQVSIQASVSSPLTSGANTIPFSQITVASSDANLPAPAIPDVGAGTPVNVTGTSFAGRVTVRNANWTFSYSPVGFPVPGNYSGSVLFTASAP